MGGPSSDFHALYQQRITVGRHLASLYDDPSIQQTNLMPVAAETFNEAVTRALALAESDLRDDEAIARAMMNRPAMPLSQNALLNYMQGSAPSVLIPAIPAIPPAQLLPKDLLPALRKAETPKEAARKEVHDFIELVTEHRRIPNTQFQTASSFVTSTVNSPARNPTPALMQRLNMWTSQHQTIASFTTTASVMPFSIRKF